MRLSRRVLAFDRFARHYLPPSHYPTLMGSYLGRYQRYFAILNRHGGMPVSSEATDNYISDGDRDIVFNYEGGTEWTRRVISVATRLRIWRRRAIANRST